ncbi:MarR family transcriptional regulator [Lysinibacillus antri]|uniref:MarR family transcriptional regulator n=1 Tax=Lysinibacillus antri TaxID=2498145 RepID=A0A432LHB8_9BACI|nr:MULTISPECIES: MarR family winged helix-turn-helix transcriptional regulator [Lysinibacillus]RUL56393.1 MarR family transcriptional regulator [Lysinibacillus antri]TSI03136.1 winged helix-turn-helix transcriptional regulator [Lysinibacillus sp. BW-2-10]
MNSQYTYLDLFDLISGRHVAIRKALEEKWNELSDVSISNSEWYIMTKLYGHQPTTAALAKTVNMSRQAIHKFIKKLEAKGLVEVTNGNNKRDKCIQLTDLGEKCIEKYISLKKDLERKISDQVGHEQLVKIKEILNLDWGL